ncbi:MAG TPA: hypothetical protein VFU07_09725 [Candidatus Lumbricidophila sp.]|nr:hypothetical protein [Candidatus Lumbricidophila sp.]
MNTALTKTKYWSRMVEIDAMRWDGTREGARDVLIWAQHLTHAEPGARGIRWSRSTDTLVCDTRGSGGAWPAGVLHAGEGDWIIWDGSGEFVPMPAETFNATYVGVRTLDTTLQRAGFGFWGWLRGWLGDRMDSIRGNR